MQKQLLPEAEGYARTNVRRRIWRRFVRVMACIVVFCTTYALILPAITLEREGVCELEEHTHSDECYSLLTAQEVARLSCTRDSLQIHTHTRDCYGADNELLCGFADFVVHEHSGACFDAAGNLVCTLPVVREHEHTDECYEPAHVHTEDCYIPEGELICELEEIEAHSHDETCTEAVLVCELTVEPHEHTDGCYEQLVCQLPEDENHTHDDSCSGLVLVCSLTEQPHTHDESCYETEYVCGLEETEGHTHEESCYASEETLICEEEEAAEGEDPRGELICQEEEIVLHIHGDDCYEVTKDAEGNEVRTLICQELEIREHVHDESCFVTETVELDTQTLTCTETDEAHEHTDRCYGTWVLTCELEEHTHTEECYPESGLSDEEQAQVDEVIALIEPLPTYDELAAKLDEFYEADDTEGEEAYLMEVYAQVEDAYRAYMALDESLREYVTNADKLMDLEFIWSQITLEEIHTADAMEDDIPVVVGDGISFRLFDYSLDINKDSTKAAWRAISEYFNFRDSSGKIGSDPLTANTTNIQNTEHDKDGFTKHHATVERKLDANRNPILDLSRNADGSARTDPGWSQEQRSLGYLFSDQGDHAVTAYYPYNTILQKSGNHYWYDSKDNAVDYDISTGAFRVRNYVERAPSTSAYPGYSDFMPFTYTGGKSVGTNTNTSVDYHAVYADVNYWYGMTMDVSFFQTKDGQIDGGDMIFNFSGDDDVWVFVDDVLVLDLGGTHGTATGSINFATGEVVQYLSWNGGTADNTEGDSATSFPTTIRACFDAAGATPNGGWSEDGKTFADYTEHTLKFFYMERGAAVANCKLDFRLPTLPDKSLTVTKDLVIDGDSAVKDFLEDTLVYKFRVMKADAEGNATNEFFVTPGMTYTILDGGTAAGTGTVASDGTFSLKAGQSAQFTDMLVKGEGAVDYVVQEIMPDDLTGQYSGVEYEVSGQGGQTVPEEGPTSDFTSFDTGKLSAESTQTVTFRNKVDVNELSILKISKALAPSASFDAGKTFDIQVKLGGQLLPVGTRYQIDGTNEIREVAVAGIVTLKIGETATILEGIISGTEFEITELGAENGGFTPSYSGIITHKDKSVTAAVCTANDASGEFTLNSVAHVTITNANYDFSGQIPIFKQALDNSDTATFSFLVEQGKWDGSNWTWEADLPGTSITVNNAAKHSGTITIGYKANTSGTFYYRISEQRGTGDYVYDTSWYIVEVAVTPEGTGGQGTATIVRKWKNGAEYTGDILFTNIKTTSLMVSKRVTGAISNGSFDFRAVVVDKDGNAFNLPAPTDGSYTVEGNVATFKLSAGQSIEIKGIPYGAKVTVTETQHDGFVAYYQVSGVHAEQQLGDSVLVSFANGVQTVTFINDGGYELPDTGGAGTYLYTMGGALLTCAAILLYIHNLKRRKEERPSF